MPGYVYVQGPINKGELQFVDDFDNVFVVDSLRDFLIDLGYDPIYPEDLGQLSYFDGTIVVSTTFNSTFVPYQIKNK